MALSAKLWPFSSFSSDKLSLQKTSSLSSSLFASSAADDEILEQLNSSDFEIRLRTLKRLETLALSHELWFKKFSKKLELFKSFSNVLQDTNWEVQHQCVKFLADKMQDFGQDTEWCMAIVLPSLVPKLGSTKITVRRVTVQCLIAYVRQVDGVITFQKSILEYGLYNGDKSLTKEITKEIPNLLISEFRTYNWFLLTEGLTELLCVTTGDREVAELALIALEKLINLVGQYQFNNYVQSLTPSQRNRYEELLLQRGSAFHKHRGSVARMSSINRFNSVVTDNGDYEESVGNGLAVKQFRYGVIPVSLVDQLNNETDWQVRFVGLETLKSFVENMSESDMKKLQPHLFSYINLLSNILDDLNIKNIVLTLDILRASVAKMRRHVEPHLQHIVAAMAKHLGNQKAVVKQLNLAIILELMRQLHPKQVFAVFCGYLQHRNSRVREEVLNIVTVALLTHPSSDFNLSAVAHIISPLLADGKRRVRLAAFESAAVLANCVAVGKTEIVMKHVREVEETRNAPGLVQAVQARLSRNQLPKIRYDGLLEYAALPISPSGDESRKTSEASAIANSADIEWIMSAGIGQGSAVSRSLSPIRYRTAKEFHDKQNGSLSVQQQRPPSPAVQRRVLSAGRNLRKLPWENIQQENLSHVQNLQIQQVDRTINRSAPVRSNEAATPLPGARPAKLVDNLSITEDTSKPNVPFAKYGQQTPNGKLVLSPLDGNVSRVGLNRTKSRISSPPMENELYSPYEKSKRDQGKRSNYANGLDSIKKTQSIGALINVTSADYKNTWDEVPIKPASKQQVDAYFSEATGVVHGNNVTLSDSPRKQSVTTKIKGPMERRRSSDSSDGQMAPSIDVAVRKPPLLVRRGTLKQPPNTAAAKNRTPPPVRKTRSDSISDSKTANRAYANPEQALSNALKKLSSDEWKEKVEGLNSIERLAKYNTDTLAIDIQPVIVALNNDVKNLRSSVSKQALECYAHLFQCLKRSMDPEVERICTVLMAKTGDTSNAFTRAGATKALENMIDHVTPQKSLCSIVATGANHKSAVVRAACSQLMLRLVENMGASKILSSQPEFVEKILATAAHFANDNQPQPRRHGKTVLAILSKDEEFPRAASRYLTDTQKRTVLELVECVKMKGLGGASTNGASSLSSSFNGSLSSGKSGSFSRSGSIRRKSKLPDEAMDTFLAATKELSSSNWEDRFQGVNRINQLSETYAQTLGGDVKILEMYMTRLNDINGKVAAQALQCLPAVLENLGPHVSDTSRPVATEMIKNLSSQLPSKNDEIRTLAQEGLDCAVKYLDNSALIQSLGIAAKTGNAKQKPDLLKRLGRVSQNIFSTKPKLVQMYALPVLYDLVKTQQADQQLRQATVDYARTLSRLIGARSLIDSATPLSPNQKMELEDMLS